MGRPDSTWIERRRGAIVISMGVVILAVELVLPAFNAEPNIAMVGAGVTLLTGGVLLGNGGHE